MPLSERKSYYKKPLRVNRDRERALAQYEAAAGVITESLLPALLGCQDMVPVNPLAGGAAAGTSACAALLATIEERLAARADAADYAGGPNRRMRGVLCTVTHTHVFPSHMVVNCLQSRPAKNGADPPTLAGEQNRDNEDEILTVSGKSREGECASGC